MAVRLLGDGHLGSQHLPREFLVNHISSSFVGMVQWWIKNHLTQTTEELADYFMAVISPVIY